MPVIFCAMTKLPQNFENFTRAHATTYALNGVNTLTLKVACPVAIMPSEDGKLTVEHEGNAGAFDIMQADGKIFISQNSNVSGGDNVSINSIVGNNISINGVTITGGIAFGPNAVAVGQGGSIINSGGKTTIVSAGPKPRLLIKTPAGMHLAAQLSGENELTSCVEHADAKIETSGSAKVHVTAKSVKIDCAGTGIINATVNGGDVKIDSSGGSVIKINGNMRNVKVDVSGNVLVETNGLVSGDYKADMTGAGLIIHRGDIQGLKIANKVGSGHISLG